MNSSVSPLLSLKLTKVSNVCAREAIAAAQKRKIAQVTLPTFDLSTEVLISRRSEAQLRNSDVMNYGITWNFLLLVKGPVGVVTVTNPVVAPTGTVVAISVSDTTL